MKDTKNRRRRSIFFRWFSGIFDRIRCTGSSLFRRVILLEAGAAIILFGSLMHHQDLARSGALAIDELKTLGYQTPTSSEPVRVYPAKTGVTFNSAHAGGWHPGIISLRENPAGSSGTEVFLRHELMHEARFRTCAGKLPLWTEEASAISFSGELKVQPALELPAENELKHLQEKIRISAPLDTISYNALLKLVSFYGWPSQPCAVSKEIEKLLVSPGPDFSSILISLVSGEVLEGKGDLKTSHPPGSLLKIPYAAALKEAAGEAVGEELAASDSFKLLNRKKFFNPELFRSLTSIIKDTTLARETFPQEPAENRRSLLAPIPGRTRPGWKFPLGGQPERAGSDASRFPSLQAGTILRAFRERLHSRDNTV